MPPDEQDRALQVVQLSDTHLFAGPAARLLGMDTYRSFLDVKQLADRRGIPDFYLLTGDLSQDESDESYRRLAGALGDLQAPAYYLPGNHDSRSGIHRVLQRSRGPFRHERSFVSGNWVIVLLDTLLPEQVRGHLADGELGYLDLTLRGSADKHALVCLHHHPIPMESRWIDRIGIDNAGEFLAIIQRHPNVRAVVGGHVHQEMDATLAGTRFLFAPSTCVQFKPRSQEFAVDPVPPGYRWLELHPDGTISTAVERIQTLPAGLDPSLPGY